jgi:hypothetical protein
MFPYFFNIAQTLHACSSDVLLLLMLSKQLTDSIAMYNKHNHYRYLPIMSRSVEKTCKYPAALFTAVTDDVKASQSHNDIGDIGDIGIALIVGAEGPGGSLGMGRTWPHTLHEDARQTMTNMWKTWWNITLELDKAHTQNCKGYPWGSTMPTLIRSAM